MSFAHRSVRRRQAEVCGPLLLLSGWMLSGCTSLLDIDDEYTLEASTGGADTRGSSGGGSGGSISGNWSGSSGGKPAVDAGVGGTVGSSTGGISAAIGGFGAEVGTGGLPPETGGVPPSATGGIINLPEGGGLPECAPGTFDGTFRGMHAPSITVVGVPLPVQGVVRFRLLPSGTAGKLDVAEANFEGRFNLIPGAVDGVPFSATMVGTYDCETGTLSGDLTNGKFADSASMQPTFIGFSGTFSARYGTQFIGTWSEAENTNTGSQQYKGDGSFSARRVIR